MRAAFLQASSAALAALCFAASAHAQTVASRFTTGGRDLVSLTFGSGALSGNVTLQSGSVRPVTHLGQSMLLIPERTALLVQLPEVLPQDFSIEVDIVPKTCCQPEDLAIEGTATIDQGPTSANILWHHDVQSVIGGALDNYHTRLTEPLASAVPGKLTQIVINVQGDNITMLTNGQQVYSLSNRKFARNNVLRVFLGGQNDTDRAMYIARLRVSTPSPVGPVVAGSSGPSTAGQTAGSSTPSGGRGRQRATAATLPSRPVSMLGFATVGVYGGLATRTLTVPGFSASGVFGSIATRTVQIPGFIGAGVYVALSPRSLTLPGFASTGTFGSLVPRTVTVPGFLATGSFATLAPRSISVPGFVASSSFPMLEARAIALPGFTSAGVYLVLPPRTLALPGWTATRVPNDY